MDAGRESLERAYREEATRIRAALAARTGDVGLAEDAVQDAFVEAIEHWPRDGVPANPGGWLATTARRKALDRLRRDKVGEDKLALLAATEAWAAPTAEPRTARPSGADRPRRRATRRLVRRSGEPDAGERTGGPTTSCSAWCSPAATRRWPRRRRSRSRCAPCAA